jgi:hypothetical protein
MFVGERFLRLDQSLWDLNLRTEMLLKMRILLKQGEWLALQEEGEEEGL